MKVHEEVESVEKMTPYMLRNDGTLLSCGEIHPYVKMFYKEDFEANLERLLLNLDFLKWFYHNTLIEETKALIINLLVLINSDEASKVLVDLGISEKPEELSDNIEEVFNKLNDATNQEFCRVRTSNFKYKYGGDNGEIYFRISSKDFDWYNLIWTTVYQFKNSIKYVTVMYDYAVYGKQFDYINNYNKVPVEEFLTESGNPVIEDLDLGEAIIKTDMEDIFPSDEDLEFVINSFMDFTPNKDDLKWTKKHFNICPWGIGYNCYVHKEMQKALKYFITAIVIKWDELQHQLTRTLKDSFKLSAKQFGEISKKWSEKLPDITSRAQAIVNRKLSESLTESFEKHETLNPKLWNEDNTLKDEVKEKILDIVDEFVGEIKEDEVSMNVSNIILVGSNCSYNYNKDSDLDIHLIVDHLDAPEDLYDKIYSAYRSIFNKNIDIEFYGIPVEIFVEQANTPGIYNGVYSVTFDKWISEPVAEDIPEIDQEALDKEVKVWEDRYNKIISDGTKELEEEINNDQLNEIDKYLEDIYQLRKDGLEKEGQYGIGNLVFKEIRNKGYLDKLKDLKNELLGKELSLESLNEEANLDEKLDYFEQESKMYSWHNGGRGANVKAMSNEKLYMNYTICKKRGYTKEAKLLLDEGSFRGLTWATDEKKISRKSMQAVFFSVNNFEAKNSFRQEDVEAVLNNKQNVNSILTLDTPIDVEFMYLVIAIILKLDNSVIETIRDDLVRFGLSIEKIKDSIDEIFKNNELVNKLVSITQVFHEDLDTATQQADKQKQSYDNRMIKQGKAEASLIGKEDILAEVLEPRQRELYRQELSRIAFNQAVIYDNGVFHIYNIKEDDVDRILDIINRLNYIEEAHKTAGRYDFSKVIMPGQMAPRYYDISGRIK